MDQKQPRKITIYDLVVVGLMAAVCFVTTMFLSIRIPTPTGTTMIKVANIFCLMSGLLFGGVRGGLAAGIGSFLFDLTDPLFIASAPFTLVFFFLMAFVCGSISHGGGRAGRNMKVNFLAAASGAVLYYLLIISKNIIELMLAGSVFSAALIANVPRLATSGINAAIAIVVSVPLQVVIRKALIKTGFLKKLGIPA